MQDSLCIESYVAGVVTLRSIEIFTKIIGEHLKTGERFLGLTAFLTFVTMEKVRPFLTFNPNHRKNGSSVPVMRNEKPTVSQIFKVKNISIKISVPIIHGTVNNEQKRCRLSSSAPLLFILKVKRPAPFIVPRYWNGWL